MTYSSNFQDPTNSHPPRVLQGSPTRATADHRNSADKKINAEMAKFADISKETLGPIGRVLHSNSVVSLNDPSGRGTSKKIKVTIEKVCEVWPWIPLEKVKGWKEEEKQTKTKDLVDTNLKHALRMATWADQEHTFTSHFIKTFPETNSEEIAASIADTLKDYARFPVKEPKYLSRKVTGLPYSIIVTPSHAYILLKGKEGGKVHGKGASAKAQRAIKVELETGNMETVVEKNYRQLSGLNPEITPQSQWLDNASSLQHPNIVKTEKDFVSYTSVSTKDGENYQHTVWFEEELRGGNLSSVTSKGGIPNEDATSFLHDVASGLYYLHHKGYSHGDIKPKNVFLSGNLAKIGDFDTLLKEGTPKKVIGSPIYVPPRAEAHQNQAGDVWAFGALAYSLARPKEAKLSLFGWTENGDPTSMSDNISKNHEEFFSNPDKYLDKLGWPKDKKSSKLRDLVIRCCQKDPADRPKMKEVKHALEPSQEDTNFRASFQLREEEPSQPPQDRA